MAVVVRLALRDLRGGVRSFRILMACLALGVFAIAAAGSTRMAVEGGIANNAQILLGGDLEISQTYRTLDADQRAMLQQHGEISEAQELRVMARRGTVGSADWAQALAEVKAVDQGYPLFGTVTLSTGQPLATALARQADGSSWGAVIEPALASRLGLAVGDSFHIGDATFRLSALLTSEPGRGGARLALGPRVMITLPALADTGLLQLGSLVREVVTVRVTSGTPAALVRSLNDAFPHAAWEIRQLDDASPGITRFMDTVTLYLTLVGLTALLVGGLGVANAIHAYLQGRIATIATLKTLGASSAQVLWIYLLQIALLALAGVLIGVVLGGGVPWVAGPLLEPLMPMPLEIGLYPAPLALAAGFGLLTALVFGLWPLLRSRATPAAALFRTAEGESDGGRVIGLAGWLVLAAGSLGLVGLTLLTTDRTIVAIGFVVGAVLALVLFRLAASGLMAVARRLMAVPAVVQGRPGVRLALSNLHRSGTQTPSLVVSLGLGLSVLVTVALIEANISHQINETLPKQGPAFYFIDLQPDQLDGFRQAVRATPQAEILNDAGIVRGRISALKGQTVDVEAVEPDVQWAVRGDRALTSAAELPAGAVVSAGQWWAADYAGPPQVSLAANLAKGLHVGLGDSLTVNVLGREITGTITSLREVQWSSLAMNFAVILSPGALQGAPTTWIASVAVPSTAEDALQRAVAEVAPNASALSIRQTLVTVSGILEQAGLAVRATALVTLCAGALVLGGALAAGQRRRSYESVILKVLGAARGDILRAHLLEYALIGVATGALAVLVGGTAAWAVLRFVMRMDWLAMPGVAGGVVAVCVLLVALAGLWATGRALAAKAAPLLRQE